MNAVLIQAAVTVKRLSRSKVLLAVLIIVVVILGLMSSSAVIMNLSLEAGEEGVRAQAVTGVLVGTAFLTSIFASLIALIIGVTTVSADIRQATIFSVLSKPIHRWQYLWGSYLGSVIYLLLIWGIFAALFLGTAYVVEDSLDRIHWLAVAGHVVLSIVLLSIAFFFAQAVNPWIAGALAILVYNGESLVGLIEVLARKLEVTLSLTAKRALGYIFPATDRLDLLERMLGSRAIELPALGWAFLHLIDYALVMVVLATLLFNHRELRQETE